MSLAMAAVFPESFWTESWMTAQWFVADSILFETIFQGPRFFRDRAERIDFKGFFHRAVIEIKRKDAESARRNATHAAQIAASSK